MTRPIPVPFQLNVSDALLIDLRVRLARVRWPEEPPGEPWAYGTSVKYMQELVEYWRERFDWRIQEAKLNSFRQFEVSLGGIQLHYIHEQGKGINPLPLLLIHGWPWIWGRWFLRCITYFVGNGSILAKTRFMLDVFTPK